MLKITMNKKVMNDECYFLRFVFVLEQSLFILQAYADYDKSLQTDYILWKTNGFYDNVMQDKHAQNIEMHVGRDR